MILSILQYLRQSPLPLNTAQKYTITNINDAEDETSAINEQRHFLEGTQDWEKATLNRKPGIVSPFPYVFKEWKTWY